MGQASRQARASRFIDEFTDDAIKAISLKVGSKLTVTRVALGTAPCDENVVAWVTLAEEGGKEHVLMMEDEYYYPEGDDEESIERVMTHFDLSEEEAEARLANADLIVGD